jgi:hypothetical protein
VGHASRFDRIQSHVIFLLRLVEIKIPTQATLIMDTHEGGLMGISAEPAFGVSILNFVPHSE